MKPKRHRDGFEPWKAKDGWRWRTRRCGRITAIGEAHKTKWGARRAFIAHLNHCRKLADRYL